MTVAERQLQAERARRALESHRAAPPAELDIDALRAAVVAAKEAGVGAEEVRAAEAHVAEVEAKRAAAMAKVHALSSPSHSKIDKASLEQAIDAARDAGVLQAQLGSAPTKLSQAKTLSLPLLKVVEGENLADRLLPLLLKHKVHTMQELAGWQEGSLTKLMGLSKPEAAALILAAKTELQLGDGSLGVCVFSRIEAAGRTEYLIRTTASSAEGHRQEFRAQHCVTDFVQLHEQLVPQLSPRLPDFPFSPRVPRFLHYSALLDSRMHALDGYLRQAIKSAQGSLPAELRAFLALPAGEISFEPGAAPAAAPPRAKGKQVAQEEWLFPHDKITWVQKIGKGGFGTVYEVRWGNLRWAAKKSECTVASERAAIETRYRKEFRALQKVQHPHIVTMYGVVVDEPGSVSLLMELSPIGSLRSFLDTQAPKVVGELRVQQQLLRGIAAGMACLHARTPQPMLHHDLKSDNVLLWADEASGGYLPKLCDFGMATGTGASTTRTTRKAGAGTFAYKAPECFEDEYTTASEVYAFAIVGWEVLTGQLPWEGKSEASITLAIVVKQERPPLPPSLGDSTVLVPLVQRCWAHAAHERPSFEAIAAEAVLAPEAAGTAGAAGVSDAAVVGKLDAVLAMQGQLAQGQRDLRAGLSQVSVPSTPLKPPSLKPPLDRLGNPSEPPEPTAKPPMELPSEPASQVGAMTRANASMLGVILQGEHDCPRWLVLVPKPPAKGALSRAAEWLKPSSWINSTVVLHFVCPVTRTAVGGGFELQLPKDWVVKYGPAIRVGLTMLQMGAAGARLAGLPVPRLSELTGLAMESMDAQLGYLKELADGVTAELERQELGFVNEWAAEKLEGVRAEYTDLTVAAQVEGVPKQLSEAVQKSYQEVRAIRRSRLPPEASRGKPAHEKATHHAAGTMPDSQPRLTSRRPAASGAIAARQPAAQGAGLGGQGARRQALRAGEGGV